MLTKKKRALIYTIAVLSMILLIVPIVVNFVTITEHYQNDTRFGKLEKSIVRLQFSILTFNFREEHEDNEALHYDILKAYDEVKSSLTHETDIDDLECIINSYYQIADLYSKYSLDLGEYAPFLEEYQEAVSNIGQYSNKLFISLVSQKEDGYFGLTTRVSIWTVVSIVGIIIIILLFLYDYKFMDDALKEAKGILKTLEDIDGGQIYYYNFDKIKYKFQVNNEINQKIQDIHTGNRNFLREIDSFNRAMMSENFEYHTAFGNFTGEHNKLLSDVNMASETMRVSLYLNEPIIHMMILDGYILNCNNLARELGFKAGDHIAERYIKSPDVPMTYDIAEFKNKDGAVQKYVICLSDHGDNSPYYTIWGIPFVENQ